MFDPLRANLPAKSLWFAVALSAALSSCGREAKDSPKAGREGNAVPEKNEDPQFSEPPAADLATADLSEPRLVFQQENGVLSVQGIFRARIKAWSSGPQVTQSDATRNAFTLEFASASGHMPSSFEVSQVLPYMKVHGHGVPRAYLPVWNASENEVNVTQLGFIMAGPWQIVVHARVNGTEDRIEIPVEVP